MLHCDRLFQTVCSGGFETGDIAGFSEGGLNTSYDCVDRWAFKHPDKTAILYEADEPGGCTVTYAEPLRETKKGDAVSIYLPMTWHAAAAFLACARIGAVHSIVFAGFSAEFLRDRILDCGSRVVVTSDEGRRGEKTIVEAALKECPAVEHVVVLKRTGNDETVKVRNYYPPEFTASEDPLFILYTPGSTGKPKGVVDTTGSDLLGAAMTVKYVFDITGHTYIVYGLLADDVSTTVFESTSVYPTPSRYWQTVEKHKPAQFYFKTVSAFSGGISLVFYSPPLCPHKPTQAASPPRHRSYHGGGFSNGFATKDDCRWTAFCTQLLCDAVDVRHYLALECLLQTGVKDSGT
ncbi:hypothetical protein EV715DRAFT_297537 [Schizophyllum commune]